jgi:3-dehydroquinate dehydratase-2
MDFVSLLRGEGTRQAWKIGVVDGPNMPNLGARDQAIYGPIRSLDDLQAYVAAAAKSLGLETVFFASNHEGEILEFIHGQAAECHAFIINPAGLTTYGEATRHALDDTKRPVAEVHFSNTARHFSRVVPPTQQQTSRFTYSATGLCMGFRQHSYIAALVALALSLDDSSFLDGGAHCH